MVIHTTYVTPLCLYYVILSVVGQDVVNVAIGKTYKQINTHNWQRSSSNAANGNTSGVYDGNNCIHTRYDISGRPIPNDTNHWWEVDLGRTYPVRDITVWARDNFFGNMRARLYPFTITVDNKTCVNVTSAPRTRNNSVTCSSVMYGRVVRLTLTRTNRLLNLCEFQIFVPSGVSQCPAGHHGAQCGLTCSDNCGGGPGNNFCYQDTGVCYDDCKDGFWGHLFCQQICSADCSDFKCRRDNGHCVACYSNRYGQMCNVSCGQCKGGQPCDPLTGNCTTGCEPGYTGQLCKTKCQAGRYGEGCSEECGNCRVDTTCHYVRGHCLEGCAPGFTEPYCWQVHEKDSLMIPVVCSVIGAAVIIAIAVVAVVCWFRRSRGELAAKHDTRGTIPDSGSTDGDTATESSGQRPPSSSSPHNSTACYEIPDTTNTLEMREVQNNYDMLHPYSNDDADRQPYSQLTSHASDVTQTSGDNAHTNTAFC